MQLRDEYPMCVFSRGKDLCSLRGREAVCVQGRRDAPHINECKVFRTKPLDDKTIFNLSLSLPKRDLCL